MKRLVFLIFHLLLVKIALGQNTGGGPTCVEKRPICTGSFNFPAVTNSSSASTLDPGIDYNCLSSQPNPSWFFFQVGTTGGRLVATISGANTSDDIDFVCWGPFDSQDACGSAYLNMNSTTLGSPSKTNPSGMCSYLSNASETLDIANAVAGKYYVLLITNFGGTATTISFTRNNTSSVATTVCNSMSTAPTACNSINNQFDLNGNILIDNPPATGTLTVRDSKGQQVVYNPPFNIPFLYTISGLSTNISSTEARTVTATFSANGRVLTANYTAPGICQNTFTAVPSACNNTTRSYSVSGTFSQPGAPNTGTLTFSDNTGAQVVFNAPFTYPVSYTLNGLSSTTTVGESRTITATYSANSSLTRTQNYTSPANCYPCNIVKFTGLPDVACKNNSTPIPLTGTPGGGTFSGSTGLSGSNFTPSLASAGTNTIGYTVGGCPVYNRKIFIGTIPVKISNVLSASVTTFSDNWPLNFGGEASNLTSAQVATLNVNDGFSAGTKGIWRADQSYSYVTDRKQTVASSVPAVNIRSDGTFDNMPFFDWTNGLMGACIPEWRNTNTITKYNPFNYEVENKDVLNIYSAALYGYKGDLTTALSSNARTSEIAFEGFEEYASSQVIGPQEQTSGNLTIYTKVPTSSEYKTITRDFDVEMSSGNLLTVNIPVDATLVGKKVKVFGANFSQIISGSEVTAFNGKEVYGEYTVSEVRVHPETSDKCIIVLNSSQFTNTNMWTGKISIPFTVPTGFPQFQSGGSATIVNNIILNNTKAHTGNMSLQIKGFAQFEQERMMLVPGRKYYVSAWVSADNVNLYTLQSSSTLSQKRGIRMDFYNGSGAVSSSALLEPSGGVIEGWQKIVGEFTMPANATRLILALISESSSVNTFFDDIRISPSEGNIQTYVYNTSNLKLSAILDNNNYASLYYYDQQGNLYLVKKETERGIQTIQESFSHIKE